VTSELIEFDRRRRASAGRWEESSYVPEPPATLNDREANGTRLSIRRIVAPFDGSATAECTVPYVAALARAFSAQVTLLRVLEQPEGAAGPPVDALDWEMARAEALAALTRLQNTLEAEGCSAGIEIVQGRSAEQIVHFTVRDSADLIVLSSHGAGGLHRWNLAGTVYKVVATTHSSVLIVPATRFAGAEAQVVFRRMLVPLDCSARAECILPAATELAKAHGAQLILAHVVPEPEMPRRLPPSNEDLELVQKLVERNEREARAYLREVQARLAASSGPVEVRLSVSPRRTQALRDMAKQEEVDLIVLCAHGSTGDPSQRYGEVTSQLLQESEVPVIILQDLAQPLSMPAAGPERRGP